MNKKDVVCLVVTAVVAGFVAGMTLGVVLMVPKTRIGRETVVECRRMRDAILDLSQEDQDRFWRITAGNPALAEDWKVRESIADIKISEK